MQEEVYRNPTIDKRALKALSQRSDAKGLMQLCGHLALLTFTTAAVLLAAHPFVYGPALLAQGIALTFLFAPLHECIHRTAFENRRLNDLVARVCGFLLLLPADYFRAFHFQHHRYTQNPAQDPELAGPPITSLAAYLTHLSGLSYWRERVSAMVRHALGDADEDFVPARQRARIIGEARWHLAAYGALLVGSLTAGSTLLLSLWLLPALLGQPFLRAFLLAEHSGCPQTEDMLVNSRTTETNAAVRWLCWNMNRHSAHHAFPALPFHALPDADAVLGGQVVTRSRGYLTVQRDILAALRNRRGDQAGKTLF